MAEQRNVILLIDGKDYTGYLADGSLSVEDAIGERSPCSFAFVDKGGTLRDLLVPGETVEVIDSGTKAWGGSIETPQSARTPEGTVFWMVDCVDWHYLCDKRIVAETYENQLAGAIVKDIVDKYIAADGVSYSLDSVADGPIVREAVFNYTPATACLDSLAEKAGFAWWIDPDKRIHFVERSTYLSPWSLDENADIDDLEVTDSRQGYRNRQYIKAGKDLTDPQTEIFRGNGSQKTFTVGFPIGKVPLVSVNGVPKAIGIKGIDTGKDWYWNKGDPVLTQDEAAEPLASTDSLEITYQGFFDVVILTTDEAAIDERKAVEGGSGWYEAVADEPYLSSREAAIQSGNAKLKRYAKIAKTVSFTTWKPGLRPGQIMIANRPADRLHNEEFLIEEVVFSEIGSDLYKYQVRAVSGQVIGGWARFFRNMATRGQTFVIRENIREDQVFIRLVQSQEGWHWTEETPVAVYACPVPSENLYPSETLIPC